MQFVKTSFLRLAVCTGSLLIGSVLHAQSPVPGGSSAGMSAVLTKFFGSNTAFTARSEVQVLDKDRNETMSITMNIAMLYGKMRSEVDMTRMKSAELPPDAAVSLKKMGMDRVVSIMRPDKKAMYLIYPGLQSYVDMPLPKEEAEALEKEPKMEKTQLGKETIDGHPCTKNRVVVTDEKAEKQEATVWNATDMKDFPVQLQIQEKDAIIVMHYKQVQFVKPDAGQFDPPANYTLYADNLQLMQKAMEKLQADPGANK
jgi:uncharacterized protein DUF4412